MPPPKKKVKVIHPPYPKANQVRPRPSTAKSDERNSAAWKVGYNNKRATEPSCSPVNTMELCPVWRKLPNELVDEILTAHVNCYQNDDPAYTWVTLRQLSHTQKRRIEEHFERFWLPKLSISLKTWDGRYHLPECYPDYVLDTTAGGKDGYGVGRATFVTDIKNMDLDSESDEDSGSDSETTNTRLGELHQAWKDYSPLNNRIITVRLGERPFFLHGANRSGRILNDTDLPGLEILDRDGFQISFLWKEAMNELLREEMFMRKWSDLKLEELYENQILADPQRFLRRPSLLEEWSLKMKLYIFNIQTPRRLAAWRHRARKRNQKVSLPRHPFIFRAVYDEESILSHLEIFDRWLLSTYDIHKGPRYRGSRCGDDARIDNRVPDDELIVELQIKEWSASYHPTYWWQKIGCYPDEV